MRRAENKLVYLIIILFVLTLMATSVLLFRKTMLLNNNQITSKPLHVKQEHEPDSTFAQAITLDNNTEVNGVFSTSTDVDFYKFTLEQSSIVYITLKTTLKEYNLYIYDKLHNLVAFSTESNSFYQTNEFNLNDKGTYFLKLSTNDKQVTNLTYTLDFKSYSSREE